MITAAVRDLKKEHGDEYKIDVRTNAWDLWRENPYIERVDEFNDECDTFDIGYPDVHRSGKQVMHFSDGPRRHLERLLNITIPSTRIGGDVHLNYKEMTDNPMVQQYGYDGPYWIVAGGGKFDFTAKWWGPTNYQRVVKELSNEVVFVQTGETKHYHPPIEGAFNMVGQTNIRQFMQLMYHADGVLCPTTFAMHLAAATPLRPNQKSRPAVVIAGGREPSHWESYPGHSFFDTIGQLSCCLTSACWKSRCSMVGDGDKKDNNLCTNRVALDLPDHLLPSKMGEDKVFIPKCMDMITPKMVSDRIRNYLPLI